MNAEHIQHDMKYDPCRDLDYCTGCPLVLTPDVFEIIYRAWILNGDQLLGSTNRGPKPPR